MPSIDMVLYTATDTVIPFASKSFPMAEIVPVEGDTMILRVLSDDPTGEAPAAQVIGVTPSSTLLGYEVLLRFGGEDGAVERFAQMEGWTRHRHVEPAAGV
jgi:hypothetical protein